MTDPIRDINKGAEDGADICRMTTVTGQERSLVELAYERIRLDTDDGLRGTDYSAARITGTGVGTDDDDTPPPPRRVNLDLRLFEQAAREYAKWGDVLFRLTNKHAPREADAVASREALAANRTDERACYHCAGHGYAHVPAKSITDCARVRSDNTIAAKLPEKVALCSWCQGAFDAVHRLPTKDEADLHHGGHIVRWPAGERYAAKLAMAVQQTRVVESERWSGGKAS